MDKSSTKQLVEAIILIDKAKRILNGLTWDYEIAPKDCETHKEIFKKLLKMEDHLNTTLNIYFLENMDINYDII